MMTQKNSYNRVSSLRELIKNKKCVSILEAHNGISGLLVESADYFDGMWESSLTDSASKGLPDIELITMDSRLQTIQQILDVTTKPMIVDGDTGGQVDHFPYWVKKLERAGVSAVIIEDKAFPKRNSLDKKASHILEDVDRFSEKIKAGVEAKTNPDFMVIARLESLIAKHSMFEALIRAEAFVKAGADGIMIHSKSEVSSEEIMVFALRFREKFKDVPLIAVPTTYNDVTDKKLKDLGFNIVIHANHMLRASYKAMQEVVEVISKNKRSAELNDKITPVKEIFKAVGYDK